MEDEKHSDKKPSFEEIMGGKDVALGKEIVEQLRSEDVGVTIYKKVYSEEKTKIDVNRKAGEEDYSIKKTTDFPSTLLGIVIPTENEGEFVYIGIQEQGFVFNTESESRREDYNPEINNSYDTDSDKFIESITSLKLLYKTNVVLREDENPEEFNKVFAASVEKGREKMKRKKAIRTESRKKLMKGLFGNVE